MTSWLGYYFVFVALVSIVIAALIYRMQVRSAGRLTALILILIVSPVLLSYFVSIYFNPLPEIMVPNLTGKSLAEAEEIISTMDLNLQIESQAWATEVITNQRPEGGRIVKAGRTVFLTLGERLPQVETTEEAFDSEIE